MTDPEASANIAAVGKPENPKPEIDSALGQTPLREGEEKKSESTPIVQEINAAETPRAATEAMGGKSKLLIYESDPPLIETDSGISLKEKSLEIEIAAQIASLENPDKKDTYKAYREIDYSDNALFEQNLRILLNDLGNRPGDVIVIIGQLKNHLNPEAAKLVVERAAIKGPSGFLHSFSKVGSFFSPAEQKTLVDAALSNMNNFNFLTQLAVDPDPSLSSFISKQELVVKMGEILKTNPENIILERTKDIFVLLDNGYLTEAQIRDRIQASLAIEDRHDLERVLNQISQKNFMQNKGTKLDDFEFLFENVQDKALLVASLKQAAAKIDAGGVIARINEVQFLTEGEKKDILKGFIYQQKYPIINFSLMEQALDKDEIRRIILEQSKKGWVGDYEQRVKTLYSDYLTDSEKKDVVTRAAKIDPSIVVEDPDFYLGFFPSSEWPKIMRRGLLDTSLIQPDWISVYSKIDEFLPYISDDPREQKEFLKVHMARQKSGILFLQPFLSGKLGSNMLRELFSADEIKEIVWAKAGEGSSGMLSKDGIENLSGLFTSSEVTQIVDLVASKNIFDLLLYYDDSGIDQIITPKKLRTIFEESINTSLGGAEAGLRLIDDVKKILGEEYALDFVKKQALQYPEYVAASISVILSAKFSEESLKPIFMEMVKRNPPAVLLYGKWIDQDFIPDYLHKDLVLESAKQDNATIIYAPKTLGEFYRRYENANEKAREKMLQDGVKIYNSINVIRTQGLSEGLHALYQKEGVIAKQEVEVLQTFEAFGLLKAAYPDIYGNLSFQPESLSQAKYFLVSEFAKRLQYDDQITHEEASRFIDVLGSPSPFLMYAMQYKDSPPHTKVIKEMFAGIMKGNYYEWKYGDLSEESLGELKKQKLIPDTLTLDQYKLWSNDAQSNLHEILSADAQTISQELNNYLQNNRDHLGLDIVDSLGFIGPTQELYKALKEKLEEVGKSIAEVNKSFSDAKKNGDEEALEDILKAKTNLDMERAEIVRERNILRLMMLTPQEVASGHLIDGEGKNKGARIAKMIAEMRQGFTRENQFIVDNMQSLLETVGEDSTAENLIATDSSSPKVLIEVGRNPVTSCQDYAGGSMNECLLGYSDPNTKILTLQKENGSIIARSIFRLLKNSEGAPSLHIERVYASLPGAAVDRAIFTHALRKAEAMGVPLYASEISQNAEGEMKEMSLPQGISSVSVDDYLVSENSRAPYSYVDSADGEHIQGEYELDDVFQIVAA